MRGNPGLLMAILLVLSVLIADALSMESDTSTERRHGWVAEPNLRGTATLLYSCLFTIFICTWNALHLNIASENDSLSMLVLRKLSGVVLGVLAPEVITMLAVKELLDARQLRRQIQPRVDTPFTVTHAMFTLMGGFAVRLPGGERFTVRSGHLINGEIELSDVLVPEKDIQDKSKADWVAKSLACLQIAWFTATIIERAVQRLPLTTLEIFTITSIICTFATFTAWWYKPFDVRRQIYVRMDKNHTGRPPSYPRYEEESASNLLNIWHLGKVFRKVLSERQTPSFFYLTYIAITLAFGGCHLIAWSFEFPSGLEQLMWRVTSIACIVLPLLILAVFWVMRWYLENVFGATSNPDFNLGTNMPDELFKPLYLFITGLYLLARLYLLVEVLLFLRSVPAGVYQKGGWSQYIPHF